MNAMANLIAFNVTFDPVEHLCYIELPNCTPHRFVALKVRILPLHFQTPRHCYPIPLSPAKLLSSVYDCMT